MRRIVAQTAPAGPDQSENVTPKVRALQSPIPPSAFGARSGRGRYAPNDSAIFRRTFGDSARHGLANLEHPGVRRHAYLYRTTEGDGGIYITDAGDLVAARGELLVTYGERLALVVKA